MSHFVTLPENFKTYKIKSVRTSGSKKEVGFEVNLDECEIKPAVFKDGDAEYPYIGIYKKGSTRCTASLEKVIAPHAIFNEETEISKRFIDLRDTNGDMDMLKVVTRWNDLRPKKLKVIGKTVDEYQNTQLLWEAEF